MPSSMAPAAAEPPAPKSYTVAVRALCEFAAKAGDLDMRFSPSPSAQEGQAAHALITARRGAGRQSEVALSGSYRHLTVRGRADGWIAGTGRLEEVKSFKGRLAAMPGNHRALHWAQARTYGWLLCQQLGLAAIELALVYLDIDSQDETVLTEQISAEALREAFESLCERFLAWAEQEATHRQARDEALRALAFPHEGFRPGQRVLAESVYRAAVQRRTLMAQAPTGIGKTMGALFPLLKACPTQQLDKLHFLTAKSSGRGLAWQALRLLHNHAPGLPLRAVELVARHKACEHPDKACHGQSCPLAKGFYDRLPAARAQAATTALLDREALRQVALAHDVCPYYLGQEMARWGDVIVGDYNYQFDHSALLPALAQQNDWRVGLIVDEAHNLIERARAMYSASLSEAAVGTLRRTAPSWLRKPLDRLRRAWRTLDHAQAEDGSYTVLRAPPARLIEALQGALRAIDDHLAEHPDGLEADVQAFYFEGLRVSRVAELCDEHFLVDLTTSAPAGEQVLNLRNLVPAPLLKPRWQAVHTATLLSATLQPPDFHRALLGLPPDTVWLDVPSPYRAEQLQVLVARELSTRWRDRAGSCAGVVRRIAAQYAQQTGNYLAFFSSHDYLAQVADALQMAHPEVPIWRQARQMGEAEQQAFLARFTESGQGIGFAVLGGSFAEGVDLPGARLIGAFIATLGLPQVNDVNEQTRRRLDELLGAGRGHDCTYLYPGLQKVVQAAGRVIRTPQDDGVVHLLDDRYAQAAVRRLLPAWWRVQVAR